MDEVWQVAIGSGIAGVLYSLYSLYRQYVEESKSDNEKQTLATISIIIGLTGIVTLGIGSVLGIILALISMNGKKHKALSKMGLFVSTLTMLPWLAVIIFGA